MKTLWFTFGQRHIHSVNGRTFDKDIVVKITAKNPHDRMMELFGPQWSMSYEKEPDMQFYKEIVELQ